MFFGAAEKIGTGEYLEIIVTLENRIIDGRGWVEGVAGRQLPSILSHTLTHL